MRPNEFEGKNEEDAVAKACRSLNLKREELQIEVLEPGSSGIFGLVGGRKAKIKAVPIVKETIPEEEPAAPEVAIAVEVPEKPVAELAKAEKTSVEPAVETEDDDGIGVAKEALENILALIPMEGTEVTAAHVDGTITLNIDGDKSGLLIGRKGKTLDALQFIVNKIVNKTLEKRTRVVVDSENYRQRRKEFLVEMAMRMGDKAKKIKKPVATNLLNPHDRRIVHLALKDDEELGTKGSGEGILKKVVIIPKNRHSSKSGHSGKRA
jgi:spoIIIJ-associated protein